MAHRPLAFSKARLHFRTVSFQGTAKLFLLCFYKVPSESSFLPPVGLGRGWLGGRRSRLSTSACPWTAPIKAPFSAVPLWEIREPRARERAALRALQLRAADQLLGGTQEGEPQIALRAGRGVSAGPLEPSGAQWAGRRR